MATRPALSLLGFRFTVKHILWLSAHLMALAVAPALLGQTKYYTATRPLRLQGFALFSYVDPAYVYTPDGPGRSYGVALGGDLDFSTRFWVVPGVELRATRSNGTLTKEITYGGGPRVILPFKRVQPYGDFLFSGGQIYFNEVFDPTYLSNRSSVFTYGGGVDVPVSKGWAVKVDVQEQRWRLSHLAPPFYPFSVSVGARYEIHGGKHSPE